jgi:polyferredoxin
MTKMNYAKGLIRHTTENALNGKKVHIFRSKLVGYAAVLIIMCSLLVMEITNRVPVSLDIFRDRTELAKEKFNGDIENVYTLKIFNKSQFDNRYRLLAKGIDNLQWIGKQQVFVKAGTAYTLPMSIAVAPQELDSYMTNITFVLELISDEKSVSLKHESRFFNVNN